MIGRRIGALAALAASIGCFEPLLLQPPPQTTDTRIYLGVDPHGVRAWVLGEGQTSLVVTASEVYALDYSDPLRDLGLDGPGEIELLPTDECEQIHGVDGCGALPAPDRSWHRSVQGEWAPADGTLDGHLSMLRLVRPCDVALPAVRKIEVSYEGLGMRLNLGIKGIVAYPDGALTIDEAGHVDRITIADGQASITAISTLPGSTKLQKSVTVDAAGVIFVIDAVGRVWTGDGRGLFQTVPSSTIALVHHPEWLEQRLVIPDGAEVLPLPDGRLVASFGVSDSHQVRRRMAVFQAGVWRWLAEPDFCEPGAPERTDPGGPRMLLIDGPAVLVPYICQSAVVRFDLRAVEPAAPQLEVAFAPGALISTMRVVEGRTLLGTTYDGVSKAEGAIWERTPEGRWVETGTPIPGGVLGFFPFDRSLFIYFKTIVTLGALQVVTPRMVCSTPPELGAQDPQYITLGGGRVYFRSGLPEADRAEVVSVIESVP